MTQKNETTKERLLEIYDSTIPHSSFLSRQSILSCMYQSYQLASEDIFKWLSENDYLSDNVKLIQEKFQKKNN